MIAALSSAAIPVAQAKAAEKKAVWVLSSKTAYGVNKFNYTYNKNGLLLKEDCVKSNGGIPSYEYVYKGTKIFKRFESIDEFKNVQEDTYAYNKKGQLSKKNMQGIWQRHNV